jgi:hypothetical protein
MMLRTDLIRPAPGDRVLTVRDPWAFLLIAGKKPIENRAWRTSHRGRLWIHAASRFDYGDFDWCKENGLAVPDADDLPGGILGCVILTDCIALEDLPAELAEHWSAEGEFCWLVADPVRLVEPIACRGRLGLWRF